MSLIGGSTIPSTLAKTEAMRGNVEAKMRPLFDHLLTLARSDAGAGRSQSAGRLLRQARKLAGDVTMARPTPLSKRIPRERLGELMMRWHGSMGDPYYAVGSYYHGGHVYPNRDIVERALSQAEADEAKHTGRDAQELRTIARGLRYYLRHDY